MAYLLVIFVIAFGAARYGTAEEWRTEGKARWIDLQAMSGGSAGFALISSTETGVQFTNILDDASSAANRVLENGSGVALGDYDNDGRLDILLCSLAGYNSLYRNLGDWRFENSTITAGLSGFGLPSRGAVFVDVDGDGSLDLLISTVGNGVYCFLNDNHGAFTDVTERAGLRARSGSMTLALADIDGNGTIDLYVTNYRTDDIRDRARIDIRRINGKVSVAPWFQDRLTLVDTGLLEFGEPDVLYSNDGNAHFTAVPWNGGRFLDESGKILGTAPKDWGLAATFHDLNGDSAPELYVCNDYWTPDRLWLNDGHGSFRAISSDALRHSSANSMGVDFADLNHDGHVDFFVTDMLYRSAARRQRQLPAQPSNPLDPENAILCPQFMQNTLFLNRGDTTFMEIAYFSGLSASDWSWQPVFVDVDLDGHADLIIPAGHRRDVQDADSTAQIQSLQHAWPKGMDAETHQQAFTRERVEHSRLYPSAEAPIFGFRNLGNLQFEEVTGRWGLDQREVHNGIAFGDLDGDGDLDFVVNNLNAAAGIYRNDFVGHRLAIRLRGRSPNTGAIGAEVTLFGGAVPRQTREVTAGGRYLSGFDCLLVFAAGQNSKPMRAEIRWRTGEIVQVENLQPKRLYEITE